MSSCGITIGLATGIRTSRLPDQKGVKELLAHLVDDEKRAPGMVVGMITEDSQERWVVGYGKLGALFLAMLAAQA